MSREMKIGLVSMMKNKYKDTLKMAESSIAGLKKDLEKGQTAQAEIEEKLQLSLVELESAKASFLKEKESFEAEKAALMKHAEDAKGQLKPTTEELSELKRHIAEMTQVVFGPQTSNLKNNSLLMLKDVYSLTKQLYAGSHLALNAVMGDKQSLKP